MKIRKSYKLFALYAATIGLAFGLMSLNKQKVDKKAEAEAAAVSYEPSAYLNLDSYFKNDPMMILTTEAASPAKASQFQSAAQKSFDRSRTNINLRNEKSAAFMKSDANDPTAFVQQDAMRGEFIFSNSIRSLIDGSTGGGRGKSSGGRQGQLPDPKSAVKIAQDYLRANGLMPANENELRLVNVSNLEMEQGQAIMRIVTFQRFIGDIPVIGESSKIVVSVGLGGEIMGVIYRFKEVSTSKSSQQRLAKQELKPAKVAERELIAQIKEDYGQDTEIKIDKVTLAYYDSGEHIYPAYFFNTRLRLTTSTEPVPYLGIIAAVRQAPSSVKNRSTSREAGRDLRSLPQDYNPSGQKSNGQPE